MQISIVYSLLDPKPPPEPSIDATIEGVPDAFRNLAKQIYAMEHSITLDLATPSKQSLEIYEGYFKRLMIKPNDVNKLRFAQYDEDTFLIEGSTIQLDNIADMMAGLGKDVEEQNASLHQHHEYFPELGWYTPDSVPTVIMGFPVGTHA